MINWANWCPLIVYFFKEYISSKNTKFETFIEFYIYETHVVKNKQQNKSWKHDARALVYEKPKSKLNVCV